MLPLNIVTSLSILAMMAGCGSDPVAPDTGDVGGEKDSGPGGDGDDSNEKDSGTSEQDCEDGDTRDCECDGGLGSQTCSDGEYGECGDCAYDVESKCAPGRYEGNAMGTYRSGAAGIPGFIAPFAGEDKSAWILDLEPPTPGEFQTIGNGCVQVMGEGFNKGGFYIEGELNCLTGKLVGEARGFYEASSLGGTQRYYYRGKLEGTYDPATKSFINTKYQVREPMVAVGDQPGGSGTFILKFTTEELPAERNTTLKACLGEDFPPDEMFPEVNL